MPAADDKDAGPASTSGQEISSAIVDTSKKEAKHNIPTAIFFEDVRSVTETHGAEALISSLQTLKEKYSFYQTKLQRQQQVFEAKIPDVERAITVIKSLSKRLSPANPSPDKSISVNFELADSLYAKGLIEGERNTIALWLGAGVMAEYKFDEAIELLEENIAGANKQLQECKEGLEFIRDQINVVDVNMTRVYNVHVQFMKENKSEK